MFQKEVEKAAETVWREGMAMAVNRKESEEKVGVPLEETVVVPPEEPVEFPTEEMVELLTEETVVAGKLWEVIQLVVEPTEEESPMEGEEETKEELEVMTWQEENLPEPARRKERAT